jgi:hypothetical protein
MQTQRGHEETRQRQKTGGISWKWGGLAMSKQKAHKSLYAAFSGCGKEEEVKAEFCKYFKTKLFALRGIDHYTEGVLFEFKHDWNFRRAENVAKVLAQVMYYARLLKSGAGLARYPLPPRLCVVDRNEAFFTETRDWRRFFEASETAYDWDRAPSTPCPKLVATIRAALATGKPAMPYVFDLSKPEEEEQFVAKCRTFLERQATLPGFGEKKAITEDNFLEVYEYWAELFGDYVRNGRKPSEYFFADIEEGKSIETPDGRVLFSVEAGGGYVPKTLRAESYRHFWDNYEKVPPADMTRIRQKADRLTEDFRRRFTGEFYTPPEFAAKGLDYLARTLGREWWKRGDVRFWDMAAGTGNLEFGLPSSALPYCYISTLDEDDAKYCEKIFPAATCFQYDYLSDDAVALGATMPLGYKRKMPPQLAADLANPDLKWVIFINPPFATANTVGGETGKKSKDTVSMTPIREWMSNEGYGLASRELFTQFLFRIAKEFAGKEAHLCLFSKLKYINSNNDQRIRDGFFQYEFERGFIFPIKCFYGAKGNFPVGFLVWNLAKKRHLAEQTILLDVFNADAEKVGVKNVPSIPHSAMLNKWCPRSRATDIMPPFVSAFNLMTRNRDQGKFNRAAPGFLCSLVSPGDDFQHQNFVFLLSAPYANAGAFSVTPDNFERAMVLHAVKKVQKATWTNDRDAFYAPTKEPPAEFVEDCVVWTAFADSNYTVALRNVVYQEQSWSIANQMHPFLLPEMRKWACGHDGIASQLAAANEDRFLAEWLCGRKLSAEAGAVLGAARAAYRKFWADIRRTDWLKWKIETWDAGFYQVRNALKGVGDTELETLRAAHEVLRAKLLPQVYALGFLNPDVDYFEE